MAFQTFIESARQRRAGLVKALHVFRREDGQFFNLDLNVTAPNLAAVVDRASIALRVLDPYDMVPLISEEEWWDFWTAPMIGRHMRYRCATHRASTVFLVVRGGVWSK